MEWWPNLTLGEASGLKTALFCGNLNTKRPKRLKKDPRIFAGMFLLLGNVSISFVPC